MRVTGPFGCRCQSIRPCPVSTSRSSNRACGFAAPGSPTGCGKSAHRAGRYAALSPAPLVRSAGPDPVAEVRGNMATLRIVTASGTLPKSGPFPPPALPGLDGTMGLSDSPHGRACPSRASRWQAVLPPLGSPVLRAFSLCRHAIATTPAGSSQGSGCSLDFDDGGLPQMTAGSAPAVKTFRGLLGVHACYGLPARGVANATLCIEGFGSIVTSTTAPIATGWSNSCQVGIAPTEERRLSTAHGHSISFQPRNLTAILRPAGAACQRGLDQDRFLCHR